MTKLIKKVTLDRMSNTQRATDPTKGTAANPYSLAEMESSASGTWPGGYVEGVGYVTPASNGSSPYPDTGNVLYPGIWVDGGRFQADHENFITVSNDTTVNVWWDSGYTGNMNTMGDPDWVHSNISADATPKSQSYVGVITAHWKKIADGEYHAVIANRNSEAGSILSSLEYTLEELLMGIKP